MTDSRIELTLEKKLFALNVEDVASNAHLDGDFIAKNTHH